jgi:hypothetical protein
MLAALAVLFLGVAAGVLVVSVAEEFGLPLERMIPNYREGC